MKYQNIDAEAVSRETLRNTALQLDQEAYQHEATVREQEKLARTWPEFEGALELARATAINKRADADALLRASTVTEEELRVNRVAWVQNWITSIETQHAGHSAVSEARKASGLKVDEHTKILAQLDTSYEVATGLLSSLDPQTPATPKASRVKG